MLRLLRPVLLAVTVLAALASADAWAGGGPVAGTPSDIPLPKYDSAGYCVFAGVNSSGVYDRQKCLQDEERSAAQIQQQWSRMPREVQITCGEIVRETGRSYFILKACLRNFARAAWSEWSDDSEMLDRSQQISRGFRR